MLEIGGKFEFVNIFKYPKLAVNSNVRRWNIYNPSKALPIKRGLCTRFTLWDSSRDYRCYGQTIRDICHLSLQDLRFVMQKNKLLDGKYGGEQV